MNPFWDCLPKNTLNESAKQVQKHFENTKGSKSIDFFVSPTQKKQGYHLYISLPSSKQNAVDGRNPANNRKDVKENLCK